ncbi:MAG TPA: hypothetical protein VMN36_09440 [Verrucomicrobiales bacterium]|nr:hypothetical protein [Verrucomicrobiales bacterium]
MPPNPAAEPGGLIMRGFIMPQPQSDDTEEGRLGEAPRVRRRALQNYINTLESHDLPKDLIQNIICGLINRHYREAQAPLRVIDDPLLTSEEVHQRKEDLRFQLLALEEERHELIEETLSVEWFNAPEYTWSVESEAMAANYLGFLENSAYSEVLGQARRVAYLLDRVELAGDSDYAPHIEEFGQYIERAVSAEALDELRFRLSYIKITDVWSISDRFGDTLAPDEKRVVVDVLLPEEPLDDLFLNNANMALPDFVLTPDQERAVQQRISGAAFEEYQRRRNVKTATE